MIVAVVGAPGHLGRGVVVHALERGHQVRAVSPHADAHVVDPRVEAFAASDADPEGLARALAGADAVALVFPPSLQNPQAYPDQVRAVLRAAHTSGAHRFVGVVGSAGSLTGNGDRLVDSDYFQETTRHFYQGVHAAWDVYREEQVVDWVAVVPAARMQTHLTDRGTYRFRTDEHLVTTDDTSLRSFDVSQISYGDCARAVVDEVEGAHTRLFVTVAW